MKAKDIEYDIDQMNNIVAFFQKRDEMNAQVHLQGVRWSPITLAAIQVREGLSTLWQKACAVEAAQ